MGQSRLCFLVRRLRGGRGGELGDRVTRWITLNEPAVVADRGYRRGDHAPGAPGPRQGSGCYPPLAPGPRPGHGETAGRSRRWRVDRDHPGPPARGGRLTLTMERCALAVSAGLTDLYLLPVISGAYPELGDPGLVPRHPLVHDGDMQVIRARSTSSGSTTTTRSTSAGDGDRWVGRTTNCRLS